LPEISRCYRKGVTFDVYMMLDVDGPDGTREWGMGLSTAQEIVKTCEDYPLELVGLAEQFCRSELAENIVPVSE